MNGFGAVIPAKAGIQRPNMVTPFRKWGMPRVLDSGFRRSDGVGISYAIALSEQLPRICSRLLCRSRIVWLN